VCCTVRTKGKNEDNQDKEVGIKHGGGGGVPPGLWISVLCVGEEKVTQGRRIDKLTQWIRRTERKKHEQKDSHERERDFSRPENYIL
jgi:hypothetical protein